MKIYLNTLKEKDRIIYSDVKGINSLINYFSLKEVKELNAILDFEKVSDLVRVKFNIKCTLNLISSYSLKEFLKEFNIIDEIDFTTNPDLENDDIILINNDFNIDEVIYSLIITSIPLNIHMDNEELPKFDGVDVLKEEDNKKSSPFDKLDDLDL